MLRQVDHGTPVHTVAPGMIQTVQLPSWRREEQLTEYHQPDLSAPGTSQPGPGAGGILKVNFSKPYQDYMLKTLIQINL